MEKIVQSLANLLSHLAVTFAVGRIGDSKYNPISMLVEYVISNVKASMTIKFHSEGDVDIL
jgi:hypothetical protein